MLSSNPWTWLSMGTPTSKPKPKPGFIQTTTPSPSAAPSQLNIHTLESQASPGQAGVGFGSLWVQELQSTCQDPAGCPSTPWQCFGSSSGVVPPRSHLIILSCKCSRRGKQTPWMKGLRKYQSLPSQQTVSAKVCAAEGMGGSIKSIYCSPTSVSC